MGVPFDHTQKALDANMIVGNTMTSITLGAGPFTDFEVWRSWINPGFSGTFNFLEATLRFTSSSMGGDNTSSATWKWQLRPQGQSSWTDLHAAVTSTFGGSLEYVKNVVLDATSPTVEDAPFELRYIFTTTDTDDNFIFTFFGTAAAASIIRMVGVSS
jgi:hypothetical protein